MPELDAHLHYRMVDVSSVKELARRWFPRVFYAKPEKGLAHRALADIRESIRELAYYRLALFVAPPGPSTEQAQAAAAEVATVAAPPAQSGLSIPARGRRERAAILDRHADPGRRDDGGCSSVGRAPGCGPGGRGFKSRHSPGRHPGDRLRIGHDNVPRVVIEGIRCDSSTIPEYAPLAQLAEQLALNQRVRGSSP